MDPDGDALFGLDEIWGADDLKSRTDPQVADEILIFGEYRPPRSEYDLLLDRIMSGIMASTHPVLGSAITESKRRLPDVGELLAMNARQQRRAVRRPPYRDLVLANCLLDECKKVADQRPDEAERCALLAEWIADQPWPDEPEDAAYIRITALLRQAEVLRLQRDWKKAELRFAAAYVLLRGRVDHHAQSSFCLHLSRLRADQGRYHEAELLLMHRMRMHCLYWNRDQPSSDDLCQLALLALKQNDPGRAMAIATRLYLDQESNPVFGLLHNKVDLVRAICMAAIGDIESVRSLMADARSRWRLILDRSKSLPFEWLECRISAHLGDLDQAIPRLEAIRRWVKRTMKLDEICLISIDLALAQARKGQAAQSLPGLLADIAEIRGGVEKPWALGSLWRVPGSAGPWPRPCDGRPGSGRDRPSTRDVPQGLAARRHPIRKIGHSDRTTL